MMVYARFFMSASRYDLRRVQKFLTERPASRATNLVLKILAISIAAIVIDLLLISWIYRRRHMTHIDEYSKDA